MVSPPTRTLIGERSRVLSGAKEKDFRLGCVEFKSVFKFALSREPKVEERWATRRMKGLTETTIKHAQTLY